MEKILKLRQPVRAVTGFDRPNLYFDVIRLADHRKVFGVCREHKRWETAVKRFERTKADILNPNNPAHETIQRKAEEYYPL